MDDMPLKTSEETSVMPLYLKVHRAVSAPEEYHGRQKSSMIERFLGYLPQVDKAVAR
jgi:hypothetical protein